MNLNITQENLHLLLPGKVTQLAQFYAEDHNCSMLEALRFIYSSPLYKEMSNENTKLWQQGSVTLYNSFYNIL